ncbi:MAG: substrate-binding domain-containing protein [Bacteroidales bacterium]
MDNNDISRIRIKDIARLAGVSAGTVDRVLHARGEVSAGTRGRILDIIEKLDYRPDILASTLAAKKPYKIAALIPRGTDDITFWKYPLAGIEEGLREIMHFGVVTDWYLFDYADRESFIRKSSEMLAGNPRGIILAPVFTEEASLVLDKCSKLGVPVVLINANICTGSCIAFVGQDSLQSGMVGARLMHYGLGDDAEILIVNFTREKGNQEHILRREEGFREYYRKNSENGDSLLQQVNIAETGSREPEEALERAIFLSLKTVRGIFVTNSRVFRVARFLEQKGLDDIILIGYDLLDENKDFLRRGAIDFLISQKPREQGYNSIMTLYRHIVLREQVERSQYLPVDIITKENLEHYTYT